MRKLAPARFVLFIVLLVVGIGAGISFWHPLKGMMGGFDVASLVFLLSSAPLLNDDANEMRRHATDNDANGAVLLAISVLVTTVVLITVGVVVSKSHAPEAIDMVMIVSTLVLAWLFGNVVYALHYAHIFYLARKDGRGDEGGIEFPGAREPDYWDFIYFSFTLGMTFQTSDCDIHSPRIRRIVIGHTLTGFVFNIGVLAFTINLLASGAA